MEEEKKENLDSEMKESGLEDQDQENTESDADSDDDVEALREKNRQLFARAKKAEDELKTLKKPKEEKATEPKPQSQPQVPDVKALLSEELEKRDLESLDLPEELKPEVQKLAKLQQISVRKAAADPYILHRKQEIEQQQKVDEAAISRNKKAEKIKFDADRPPQVDLSTEEGRKVWAEYKRFLQQQS